MTQTYGRKYKLTVSKLLTESDVLYRNTLSGNVEDYVNKLYTEAFEAVSGSDYVDFRTDVSQDGRGFGLEFTDLQIRATVESQNEKSTNNAAACNIQIYNLSKENRLRITTDSVVRLQAGYASDGELPIIFVGQISAVSTKRSNSGEDYITQIQCLDALTVRKNIKIAKSYPPNTTYRTVIEDLLKVLADNGVPKGKCYLPTNPYSELRDGNDFRRSNSDSPLGTATIRLDRELPDGYSVYGLVSKQLEKVCNEIDYNVYYTLGQCIVEPKEFRVITTKLILDSDDILGEIEQKRDDKDKLTKAFNKGVSTSLKTPLNGKINNNTLLFIRDVSTDSNIFKGNYRIKSISHSLDLYGNDWYTEIEAVKL